MTEPILSIRDLNMRYGGVRAVDNISADVERGEITGLIGPNGSGKTTLLNLVSGVIKPQAGTIQFEGRHIHCLSPHEISRAGIARTFQRPRVFRHLSVLENLLAVHPQGGDAPFRDHVRQEMDRLELTDHRHSSAGDLPFGYQKRLELARALLTRPRLLLLDEVFAGIETLAVEHFAVYLQALVANGLSIVVIDHDMEVIMDLCGTVLVLDFGRLVARGTPTEVQANPQVLAAYLGDEEGAL